MDYQPLNKVSKPLVHASVSSSSGRQLLVSAGSLLDDQHWHHVKLERLSAHLNLTVDKNTHQVHIPVELSHWEVHQKAVLSHRNFHGCMENLLYNNLNLIHLAKNNNDHHHHHHQASVVGNVTFACAERVSVSVTFTDSQSFLQLPGATSRSSGVVSAELQFRTWNKAGLLLTFDLLQQEGTVWLHLSEGRLRLQINKAGGVQLELSAGCPEESSQECENPFGGFQGCMRLLAVDNQPLDLIKVQQRLLGNYSHLQIDMCSPSHCEHGGRCTQSWSTFHCNCSTGGYRGATCHSCKQPATGNFERLDA
ncbi:Contactin-associated protein-like 4 [Liparis tanakae]|uniref:Contactin-associated protein-like 4 n=1 Tax=Liparis tanakae TaxID=230148 RepID=A0A4Z2GP17_9TELE|nr:Contactin-associated protein-like 4 [Liparis tanakae]